MKPELLYCGENVFIRLFCVQHFLQQFLHLRGLLHGCARAVLLVPSRKPHGDQVDSPGCPLYDLLGQGMNIHVGLVGIHQIARKSC